MYLLLMYGLRDMAEARKRGVVLSRFKYKERNQDQTDVSV